MVLARVGNVKSGWKSMFMVFTTAASDDEQTIVRLAFETIEKIVREHFQHITETVRHLPPLCPACSPVMGWRLDHARCSCEKCCESGHCSVIEYIGCLLKHLRSVCGMHIQCHN